MSLIFDLSLLPEASHQFVVLSDTHYMVDPGSAPLEFESRRHQSARASVALQTAAALPCDFAVHLGDLVQEYPDTPDFERALDEALAQLRESNFAPQHVAGNHDVGDKPDASMPTHPTDEASLASYHSRFGPSHYAFDCGPLRAIVLNSQTFNTPYSAEQRAFFERELSEHASRRIAVFLHLPPYLWDAAEPHWGHYDNIGEPDRTWLLDLLVAYDVEILFCGHVHFAFYDRLRNTRMVVVPSTSFTRPGFGHLFASAPAPEQGRDDRGKLGFYFCRLVGDRIDLHLVRTEGNEALQTGQTRFLTRTPAALDGAPLGWTLTHALCPTAQVPIAFPSVVRQHVRNDYPFLSLLEIGATRIRVPWTDLEDPLQKRRLQMLRSEGVRVHVFAPHIEKANLHTLLDGHPNAADVWEVQLAGSPWPSGECLMHLADCQRRTPLALCPVLPGQKVYGKQHPRTRIGYRVDELVELNARLAQSDLHIESVCCRIDGDGQPVESVDAYRALLSLSHIGRVDWLLSLPHLDDQAHALLACRALFATAALPDGYLFVDPPQDLDRTMDACHGLIDTRCNPRPAFHALRSLNTLLHAYRGSGYTQTRRAYRMHSSLGRVELLSGDEKPARRGRDERWYDLVNGTVKTKNDGGNTATESKLYVHWSMPVEEPA